MVNFHFLLTFSKIKNNLGTICFASHLVEAIHLSKKFEKNTSQTKQIEML